MTPGPSLRTAVILTLAASGGCFGPERIDPALAERDQARQEARQLREQLQQARTRLAERDRQVENLLALGDKRIEKLYLVQRLRLGSGTGGADLDGKPGDEAVKVFLEPIDQHGSVLKASGAVTIQLYDLAAGVKGNLLAEYRFDLDETAKCWHSGFLAYHYRFTCRWKTALPTHDEITVRVEFLDYLTGTKHTAQKLCKIDRPLPPSTRPATQPATRPAR